MIYEIVKNNSFKNPDKIALVFDKAYTYKEIIELVDNYKYKFPKFSHVAVLFENSIEFVVFILLASKYQFSIIPLSVYTKNIDFYVDKMDIDFIVTKDEIKKLNITKKEFHNYILVTTSGSTSEPKPIVLTEEIKLKRIEIAKSTYNLSDKDTILISTPLYHSLAIRGVLMSLVLNATGVVLKQFNPKEYLQTIQDKKVTFSFSVSSQLEAISDIIIDYDVSSVKSMVSTSYSIKQEIKKKLLEYFDIYECYGTSEIGCITHLSPQDIKIASNSVGKALKSVEIKIENGEIIANSLWRAKEYYKIKTIPEWFNTGDLGEIKEGYLYYKGRTKELIKTGGISVYPIDIEKVILEIDGVKEVAVIGLDDSYFGEIVAAIIVGDVKKNEIMRYLQKRLLPYQIPLFYDIVDTLPKNHMGKLQKFKLKEKYKHIDIGKRLKGIK